MSTVGDFQIVGLRTFGQVWSTDDEGKCDITTFAGPYQATSGTIRADESVADSNKLIPQAPPGGWGGTGYGDLVSFKPGNPAQAAGAPYAFGPSRPASTVLFLHNDETGADYWLLATLDDQSFVLAFPDEVTLVTAAPPP